MITLGMTLRDRARQVLHKMGVVDSKLLNELEVVFAKLVAEERALMHQHFSASVAKVLGKSKEAVSLSLAHLDDLNKRMDSDVKEKADQDLKEAREAAIKEIGHYSDLK